MFGGGVTPAGAWTAERVWEPDLAAASKATVRPSLSYRAGDAAVRAGAALASALALK